MAGADGFGDEVFAFEAEEVAGLVGFAAEGGAELLYAGVGAAGDGWSEAHSPQCTRRVVDDRAEQASPKRTDGIKS